VNVEPFLQSALDSRYGILIRSSSAGRLKAALYRARQAARDKSLTIYDGLKFLTSPSCPETDVWIVRDPTNETEALDGETQETA